MRPWTSRLQGDPGADRSGRIRRAFRWPLRLVVGYCLAHLALVAFPQLLFPRSFTRHGLSVHARGDIGPEMSPILDRVHGLISASELHEPGVGRDIVLVDSFALSRYLLLRNVHFGCNLANGCTFITKSDAKQDLAYCMREGPTDRRLRSLSGAIAHEIAHAMIRDHVGIRDDRKLPTWLKEGLCEFIAQGSAIDHDLGLDLLVRGAGGSTFGFASFKYRVMVEYLLLDRGVSLESLLQDPPGAQGVEDQLRTALGREPKAYLHGIGSTIGRRDPIARFR